MEELRRFDIARAGDVLMIIVESDFIPPEPAIVVIPILQDYPAALLLNPTIQHDGADYVLATRLITAARRSSLRRVGTAEAQADRIIRAIDLLLTGF